MSFAALALVLGHVAMFGAAREADEGTAAHLFHLLMVAQVPIVAVFAIRWLPRIPRPARRSPHLHRFYFSTFRMRGLKPPSRRP